MQGGQQGDGMMQQPQASFRKSYKEAAVAPVLLSTAPSGPS